jgi:hypothetical protein
MSRRRSTAMATTETTGKCVPSRGARTCGSRHWSKRVSAALARSCVPGKATRDQSFALPPMAGYTGLYTNMRWLDRF